MTIATYLPHRSPFVFVDEVTEIDDDHVAGTITFRGDDDRFVDPRVISPMSLIEALAQLSGIHLRRTVGPGRKISLVSVKEGQFAAPVPEGVPIHLAARPVGTQLPCFSYRGRAVDGEHELCSGTITLYLRQG